MSKESEDVDTVNFNFTIAFGKCVKSEIHIDDVKREEVVLNFAPFGLMSPWNLDNAIKTIFYNTGRADEVGVSLSINKRKILKFKNSQSFVMTVYPSKFSFLNYVSILKVKKGENDNTELLFEKK